MNRRKAVITHVKTKFALSTKSMKPRKYSLYNNRLSKKQLIFEHNNTFGIFHNFELTWSNFLTGGIIFNNSGMCSIKLFEKLLKLFKSWQISKNIADFLLAECVLDSFLKQSTSDDAEMNKFVLFLWIIWLHFLEHATTAMVQKLL